jgi:hypothetical protein
MWRELIESLTPQSRFHSPANKHNISDIGVNLGVPFPKDLIELLCESDGVLGEYGLNMIWPLERIHSDNLSFRTNSSFKELYMPFENLLFFADAGNGDPFAYRICNAVVPDSDIFAWNHENDSRTWVAPSLRHYLEWWLTGRIKV